MKEFYITTGESQNVQEAINMETKFNFNKSYTIVILSSTAIVALIDDLMKI